MYLRGPVLGMVLRLRGLVALHASAVVVDGSAVALVGATGAGKSTTAAAFVKAGRPLLCDDVVALQPIGNGFDVLPGCPRLKLWPTAACLVYGDDPNLPRLAPPDGVNWWWDKRYRDLQAPLEFCPDARPLSAVYVLTDRLASDDAPAIEPFSPAGAFVDLVDATTANYALDGLMRAQEFETLGALVRTIPVRRLSSGEGANGLVRTVEAILSDFRNIAAGAPGLR